MSSQAQVAANRANAQLSTGPKSDAGKAASSQNNFRHGFTGAFGVLPTEKQEEFDALLAGLRAEHAPAGITETLLVEKMAHSWWLTQRALALQNTCFSGEEIDQKQLALFLRYQTANERAFYKALNELLKLRAERRKAEIGFESQQHRQAAEKRRQELHKWKVLRAEAEVDHRVLLNLNRQTSEHTVSVDVKRIIATENAA